jgi:hypothetical protein
MPNTASLNLTSAQSLRDYVEDFGDDLIYQGFYGFKTADYMTPHEGVKGKKWLTTMLVADLARRWQKQYNAPNDLINFKPRALEVEAAKVELTIYPQDFESTYLGKKRKKGQNMDIPMEGDIMMQVMKKLAQEFEVGVHQAEESAVPAPTDLLKQLFNGYNVLIADLISGGHAPVSVPGGVLTTSNIIPHLAEMVDAVGDGYKEGDLEVIMSSINARKYFDAHVAKYNGSKPETRRVNGVKQYRLEDESGWIVPLPGRKNSNRIIVTPPGNLHWGYDDVNDWTVFNFEQNKRAIDFWMDFKIGVQIFIAEESAFVVNNLV